ncbi:type I RM modification enzyme [Streptococcus pneumoniae]|uniref:restriction endonuclease subunit S n=1 Tax=Streptococcus pneumoniae TaxID=1313 RepID=UPI0010248620|nr:restriction endonuclease subunit S [Streptococcus pneumoniae]VFH42372.1 type I RM modification enzyme [Streptococcus pneumoniae]
MKKVKLGEVATFINGYAFKPQDWSSEGKEIIRIQNLTKTSTEINYYSGTIDKKYIVEAGDILISWSGTLGVFQWRGRSAVLNQHIFKVVFDKIDIDKSYFKYVVEKGLQDAVKHTHGSTMKHLTKKYFDNIIVPYTNLGEQQRIASELDLLSKLILRRQEQLEELNLLVKSRFNEMFGENKIFESIDNLFDIIDGDRGKLKKILLPLPPLALQNEFADFVALVDKSQLAIQKSLEELETLKKSLMQEYFG